MNNNIINVIKRYLLLNLSFLLGLLLTWASITLIIYSTKTEGWTQNLLLSLGTGVATSALVSYIVYINDLIKRKREMAINRESFLNDYKLLVFGIVRSIDFNLEADGNYSYEEYVKAQHRWFHEYYKTMVANNHTQKETTARVKALKNFVINHEPLINYYLGDSNIWKKCGFTYYQKSELDFLKYNFMSMSYNIEKNEYQSAFLDCATFLEIIKRVPEYFDELKSFSDLRFIIKDHILTIDYKEFDKKEPFCKFLIELFVVNS